MLTGITDVSEWGEIVQWIKQSRGETDMQLAVRFGVARQTVANWRRGKSIPTGSAQVLIGQECRLLVAPERAAGADDLPV